jgi:uncharacterized protein
MSRAKFILPLIFFTLICGGIAAYCAMRLIEPFAFEETQATLVKGFAAVVSGLIFGAFLLTPLSSRRSANIFMIIAFIAFGFLSITLVLVLTWDSVRLLCFAFAKMGAPEDFLLPWNWKNTQHQLVSGGILTGAVTLSLAALYNASKPALVRTIDIPITGLNPGLNGFRIVQISDIHIGQAVTRKRVVQIVDQCNSLDADIIAVTGDLADGDAKRLRDSAAPLAKLQARHGVWFVTGNHDYYSGVDPWCKLAEELNMKVLINASQLIAFNGQKVQIAGVTDPSGGVFKKGHAPELAQARGQQLADFRLLLAHQPDCAETAASLGFDLQLSGHTHGGQYFPFNLMIHLVQRYVAGHYQVGEMALFVHRGTTWWGPPMRLGSRHEIALLQLKPRLVNLETNAT